MSELSQVLLDDPSLAEALEGKRLRAAQRDCVARTTVLPPGEWVPQEGRDGTQGDIGLLVVDGLLLRRVELGTRFSAELLGDGDVLRPWQRDDLATTLPRSDEWAVLEPTRVAILDGAFTLRASRYPEVVAGICARLVRRQRALAAIIAIVHHPRVDARLQMLFWELADRWGTVHRDGVRLPLRLPHAVLADLVAAQRQTVSKALGDLAERGLVRWTGEAWLISGPAPAPQASSGAEGASERTRAGGRKWAPERKRAHL